MTAQLAPFVMAGLDPAIHPLSQESCSRVMGPRVKPGGDGKYLWRAR
jgi:hypothetical protein